LFWKADKFFKIKSSLLFYFFLGGLVLAGLSEYSQSLMPGRSFNPFDLFSNASGIIVGVFVPKLILK